MIVLDPLLRIAMIAIQLYIYAVIISAILSWLVHFGVVNTRNQLVSMIGEFLWRLTEPALRPIRRFVPSFGGVDISPIVLILALLFFQMVIGNVHIAMMRAF
jgi:YggT family protein